MKPGDHREPPPLLGTWGRLYTAVVLYLIVIIAAMAVFTKAFNL